MSKTKKWFIIAISLIVLGTMIFVVVMSINNWDFHKLATERFETTEHIISDDFSSIVIDVGTDDIYFIPSSDNEQCKVVCKELVTEKHSVSVANDKLMISNVKNNKKWYENIGIIMSSPQIIVYLSNAEYKNLVIKTRTSDIEISSRNSGFRFNSIDITNSTGDIDIDNIDSNVIGISTTTGDVNIENITTQDLTIAVSSGDIELSNLLCEGNISLSVSTGDVEMGDINCKNIMTKGTTGDLYARNVIVAEKITATRNTGDIVFDRCDANDIYCETSTGDIEGSLTSEKIFIISKTTGDIDVPKTTSGGKFEAVTDTGDVEIKIV